MTDPAQDEDEDTPDTKGEGGDDDDSGETDDTEDLVQASAKDLGTAAPAAAATPAAAAAPVDKNQAIKDFVAQQYGKASDPAGVQAALARSQRLNTVANFGDAIESLARANSQAHGGQGVDTAFYQGLKAQGQQGIQQAQASRDAQIRDFLTKQQLGTQTVASGQEEKLRQGQIDAGDPASRTSKIARAAFKANFPDIAKAMGADFENLSTQDLGHISQITDTKAKIDAAKEAAKANRAYMAAMLSNKQGNKDEDRDLAFGKSYGTLQQKYNTASADLDKQDQMIQQAAGSQGGIAGALVKGGALHEALGRVSQGELGMAQDPSIMNRAQSLYNKITNGDTLTAKDIEEYKAINAANRAATDQAFQSSAQQMTDANDRIRASHDPNWQPGTSAGLVGFKPKGARAAAGGPAAPAPSSGTATAAPAQKTDPQIADYAAQNKLDYATAKQILVNRGYKPNEQ